MLKIPKILFVFLFLGLTACNFTLAADVTPPPGAQSANPSISQPQPVSSSSYPLVPPSPAEGKLIFAEKCAPCHGTTGLGDGERAADLPNPVTAIGSPDIARNVDPVKWYNVVTQGNLERFMPPFPSLTDRQRWDVVAYTLSLSSPTDRVTLGQGLYQENCASCHGVVGEGDGAQAAGMNLPNFTSQEYMANQSAADLYQVISAGKGQMPGYSEQLSEGERWALADYLRSLTFAAQGSLAEAETDGGTSNAVAPQPSEVITATQAITATQSAGMIVGSVENLSGGDIPIGAEIILHGFDEMQMVISQTTRLQPDGTYTFPGLELAASRMFFTTLQHQGVTYGSDVSTAQGGEEKIDLPIRVYDSTSDPANVKIDRLHLFFEQVDAQTMRVAELVVMSNTGDKTVVPSADGKSGVSFKLPEGYQDLQFQDGELGGRFLSTQDGFSDTASIYPGQGNYQVLLAYTLPYKRKLHLKQTLTLPADAIVVLAPENFKVKGDGLEASGTRDMSGVVFQMFDRAGLDAGDSIDLTISSAGFSLGSSSTLGLVIGLAALGLALVVGGSWMYVRNRKLEESQTTTEAGTEIESQIPNLDTPEALMDAILAVDDQYQAGQLPEEAYRQRRADLKERLNRLVG